MSKKKKPSLQSIAEKAGVSRQTLYKYKASGVDVYDIEAVKNHQKMIPSPVNVNSESDSDLQCDFDDSVTIYEKIDKAKSYEEVRVLKMQQDAKLQAYKLEVEEGKHTKNSVIRENTIRIGSALKAALLRYENDLPPMCEGLNAAKIQKIVREKNNLILEMFFNLQSELYKQDD